MRLFIVIIHLIWYKYFLVQKYWTIAPDLFLVWYVFFNWGILYWHTIFYQFQEYIIVVQHLYTLQIVHYSKSSNQLSPYKVIALLAVFPTMWHSGSLHVCSGGLSLTCRICSHPGLERLFLKEFIFDSFFYAFS